MGTSASADLQQQCVVLSIKQAIAAIAQQWKDGYNSGNVEKVAALYDDDAYYLTQHFAAGILHGRPRIKAYVQRAIDAGYHIDSIQIMSTGCSGDLAYSVGQYESTNAGTKAFGVNLVVLKRIGNKWLITAHESAVPDAGAIQRVDLNPTK